MAFLQNKKRDCDPMIDFKMLCVMCILVRFFVILHSLGINKVIFLPRQSPPGPGQVCLALYTPEPHSPVQFCLLTPTPGPGLILLRVR